MEWIHCLRGKQQPVCKLQAWSSWWVWPGAELLLLWLQLMGHWWGCSFCFSNRCPSSAALWAALLAISLLLISAIRLQLSDRGTFGCLDHRLGWTCGIFQDLLLPLKLTLTSTETFGFQSLCSHRRVNLRVTFSRVEDWPTLLLLLCHILECTCNVQNLNL